MAINQCKITVGWNKTTKSWISNNNVLYKARDKDGAKQIKVNGKWQNITEPGRYIKTKTLYCTNVNHKSGVKKDFKEKNRYQVNLHAGLGQSAGYIYDEDGQPWQLYRSEDVGFHTLCQTYLFEAQYK